MSSHPQQLFENSMTGLVWEGFFWARTWVLRLLGKSCLSACPGSEPSWPFLLALVGLKPWVFPEQASAPPGLTSDNWGRGSSQGNPREFLPVFTSLSLWGQAPGAAETTRESVESFGGGGISGWLGTAWPGPGRRGRQAGQLPLVATKRSLVPSQEPLRGRYSLIPTYPRESGINNYASSHFLVVY